MSIQVEAGRWKGPVLPGDDILTALIHGHDDLTFEIDWSNKGHRNGFSFRDFNGPDGALKSHAIPSMDSEEQSFTHLRPDGTPFRILIACDDPGAREGLSWTLGDFGIVTEAGSVEDAILACHVYPYDLCFLDQSLKGMDGFEVERQISMLRPEAWIVIMTTGPIAGDMAESHEPEALRILPKPFEFSKARALAEDILSLPRGAGRNHRQERRADVRVLLSRPVRMSLCYADVTGTKKRVFVESSGSFRSLSA